MVTTTTVQKSRSTPGGSPGSGPMQSREWEQRRDDDGLHPTRPGRAPRHRRLTRHVLAPVPANAHGRARTCLARLDVGIVAARNEETMTWKYHGKLIYPNAG